MRCNVGIQLASRVWGGSGTGAVIPLIGHNPSQTVIHDVKPWEERCLYLDTSLQSPPNTHKGF